MIFLASSAAKILEHHYSVVSIVRLARCRLDNYVCRHAAKEDGVHLERPENHLERCRIERADAVFGDEKVLIGLIDDLMNFRCPGAKLERAKFLGGPKKSGEDSGHSR